MSQVKDPVCGMMIDIEAAAGSVAYESEVVYFCSDACLRKFQEAPEQYERHEPPFTVKGKMAAPKFGSAGSGGLEYEGVPERHDKGRGGRKK